MWTHDFLWDPCRCWPCSDFSHLIVAPFALTSLLFVPPQPPSLLSVWNTDHIPTHPAVSFSSSLSNLALNHYSWACRARRRTCPPMVWSWVQALKCERVSVILETSAADPVYFKDIPGVWQKPWKQEALILWSTAFSLLLWLQLQKQLVGVCYIPK